MRRFIVAVNPMFDQAQISKLNNNKTCSIKPVKVTAKEIEYENEEIQVDLKIPIISNMKNKNIQNDINNRFGEDIITFKSQIEKQAGENAEESKKQGWDIRQFSAFTEYKVTYNKGGIISIPIIYYEYTGGAHGMTEQRPYNIDILTGKDIKLQDLFKKEIDYKNIINNEVKKQMLSNKELYFKESIKNFKGISDDQPFYIQDDAVVVYFGLYEISPYASGIREFKIPFSKFNDGVKERFLC